MSLNDAIESLNPLFENLRPVAQVLADPSTELDSFFAELARDGRDRRPGLRPAGAVLHQRGDRVRGDLVRPGGAPGDDLRGPGDAADRDRHPAARSGRSWPSSPSSRARLRPGVHAAAARAAEPEQRRSASARRCCARTPPLNRDLRKTLVELRRLVDQPKTKLSFQRLELTFDEAQAAPALGGPGADRLQLLELLVHELPRRLRPGRDRLQPPADRDHRAARRASRSGPLHDAARRWSRPRSAGTPAGRRTGSRATWSRRQGSSGPTTCRSHTARSTSQGQPGPEFPDCHSGQHGYPVGAGPAVRAPVRRPRSRGVTYSDLPGVSLGPTTTSGARTAVPRASSTPESKAGSREEPSAESGCRTGRSA